MNNMMGKNVKGYGSAGNKNVFIKLDKAQHIIELGHTYKQFCIYNPTSRVIKVSVGLGNTDIYDFSIAANKLFVSPPFDFTQLTVTQDTFTAALVNPTFTAYKYGIFSPVVSPTT